MIYNTIQYKYKFFYSGINLVEFRRHMEFDDVVGCGRMVGVLCGGWNWSVVLL